MTEHKIGTREEWEAARKELLERENEHAQRSEELAQLRRELPWVPVEKEYTFAVGTELEVGMLENPGWVAFALEDGVVYQTYSRFAPDRDFVVPYYQQLLDRTPKGRVDEFRATRRDEYE